MNINQHSTDMQMLITGDTHSEWSRFGFFAGRDGRELTERDYAVITGDFGFLFYAPGSPHYVEQQKQLDEMEKFPYTILFVDGNHENFDLLNALPVEEWKGGKVHRVRRNVLHLMRGQVYDIDGVRVFAMGGAYSVDKYMRSEGFSWWRAELPTAADYKEATANLERVGKKVDIILTHTAPREIIRRMGKEPDLHDMELTGFLEWIMYEVEFKQWFFGHWHTDAAVTDKVRAVYFDHILYGNDAGEV